MIQNYNTIINTLNQFANAHLSLKRFKVSFFDQMDPFTSSDNSFPILYVIPNDVSFQENIDVISFRVYCVDLLQKDRSNEQTVLNQTLLIQRDLTNWLRQSDNDLNILNNPRAIPINNFGTDFTVGWYVDFEIEATPETTDCSIPFSSNFQLTGITCSDTYINQYLTCDTLAACQTIIDIQNEIASISGGTGGTFTGGTVSGETNFTNGLTANTISATTYLGLPLDITVTGGTYSDGTALFTNNTGGTFNVSGFFTGETDTFIPYVGATQDVELGGNKIFFNTDVEKNAITVENISERDRVNIGISASDSGTILIYNTNDELTTKIDGKLLETGNIFSNTIESNSISATTYQNLPIDIRVTGGTYSNGILDLINNTGGTFSVSGFSTGGSTFTGGTVSGETNFTNGLTATTISATTYLGLPIDVNVTGGTLSGSVATFTNNTGGTFSVSGFSTGGTSTNISTFRRLATNHTLDSTDLASVNNGQNLVIEMNVGSTNTLTIPPNSAVTFSIGTSIDVTQYSSFQTTITPGSGVTLRSSGSFLKLAAQYSACTLLKVGTNEWYIIGQLAP